MTYAITIAAPSTEHGHRPLHDGHRTATARAPRPAYRSPAMRAVDARIAAAARSAASVFITGESGTGKELCAHAIHAASRRSDRPFVPLNCAAIPRELMESEIFGHRRGAFTGAVGDREGAAALADGGTLFLDEICEMDLELQAKLLRFVQTGSYKRVGDDRNRQTDIRFVCATNRDPWLEVQEGRFREDLYYRLFVVPVHLPPLRERGDDVAVLAEEFLGQASRLEGKHFRAFAPDALDLLLAHAWPGNVRELENTVRTIVVLNDGEIVTAEMLPTHLCGGRPVRPHRTLPAEAATPGEPAAGAAVPAVAVPGDWLVRPIEELEFLAIEAAMRKFDGNIMRAALALGISVSSIYRKKKAWAGRPANRCDSSVPLAAAG